MYISQRSCGSQLFCVSNDNMPTKHVSKNDKFVDRLFDCHSKPFQVKCITMEKKPCRIISWLVLLLGTAGIALIAATSHRSSPSTSMRRRQLQVNTRRPTIYTFYNPLLEDAFVTGMTESGDAALVEEWKTAWWDAGFEPRVLTLEDAKTHPQFIPIDYAMEHTWLDGYNKMCIWRWVAMSNVGGGWMSDYDVFPLKSFPTEPLPNGGALTVHDRFIPDLASGSSEEWIRVAREIVNTLLAADAEKKIEAQSYKPAKKKRRTYTLWTDMIALQYWSQHQPDMFQGDSMVMLRAFDNDDEGLGVPWSAEKCQERTPAGITAVHFSHEAIKKGLKKNLLREGQTLDNRAAIAKEWLADWKSSCGYLDVNQ